ncbi:MAG: hypothetical protein H0X24_12985 [Ktedonobacterales bacterium]|nr:hypothetical protein [Ktedonobacterales bacterium]
MPETEYVARIDAIIAARLATGRGNHIINRIIDELAEAGKITIFDDPVDRRKKMISREDVQVIIDALKSSRREV